MSMPISNAVEELRQRGTIRDADVQRLRDALRETDAIKPEDAEALIALHAACHIQDRSWSTFLVESLAEYLVHHAEPQGYVVSANGRWLIDQIGRYGRVETSTELALLIHVLDTARWTPPSLSTFALAQIRQAVTSGTGPLRAGRVVQQGAITLDDVELAARIIASFGGDTALAITRAEADALIDINRAVIPDQSSPAWSALFVRAIGSAVLSSLGYAVPPRSELREATLIGRQSPALLTLLINDRQSQGGGSSTGRDKLRGGLKIWATAAALTPEERALARLARQRLEIVTNEVIEEASDAWLMSRLAEPRDLNPNEAALLAFLAEEASQLPPALSEFVARARIAA